MVGFVKLINNVLIGWPLHWSLIKGNCALCFWILSDGSKETKKQIYHIWKFFISFCLLLIQPETIVAFLVLLKSNFSLIDAATLTPQTNISIINWTIIINQISSKFTANLKPILINTGALLGVFERISQGIVWQRWTQLIYQQNWESQDLFDLQALERLIFTCYSQILF